jgi:hypothetical protein
MCRVLSPSSPSVLAPPPGVGNPAARARAPLGARELPPATVDEEEVRASLEGASYLRFEIPHRISQSAS